MKILLIFILSLLFVTARGQAGVTYDIATTFAEELADNGSDPEMVQRYTELLSELSDEPVNINSADEDEVSRLFFLSEFQVKAIIDYVRTNGQIVSVYEIANIPGFDSDVAGLMMPYVVLDSGEQKIPFAGSSFQALNNFIFRSDDQDSLSEGSDLKHLGKYKLITGKITLGLVTEKDRGEKYIDGTPPYPDFFSAFLSYKGNGFVRSIIIGDFSSRFGLGSSINTGTGSIYSLTSRGFSTSSPGPRGYTSADENSFYRGVAGTFSSGRFTCSMFLSSNRVDANIDTLSGNITSFYSSGLHNTPASGKKKDAVAVGATGINIYADLDIARIGMTYTTNKLSVPVNKTDVPENAFSFRGDHNQVLSFYYSSVLRKNLLFGEASFDSNLNPAFYQGFSMTPSGRFTINFFGGITSDGYASIYGKSPVTGSSNRAEKCILANFTLEASKNLFISSGCLFTVYPWIRQGCSSPSASIKKEIRLKYLPAENTSVEAIYVRSESSGNSDEVNRVPSLVEKNSDNYRLAFRYSPSTYVSLGTRLDLKVTNLEERGYAIIQDLSAAIGRTPLSIWARYCIYSTDSWNARIYAYENDLLYSFSIPAMYGEGCKSYVMLKCRMGNLGEIRFKYGITSAADGLKINNQDEFRLQVKIVL